MNRPGLLRRGGRVVECTALEMRHRGNSIGGSNPSLSAILLRAARFAGFGAPAATKQDALRSLGEGGRFAGFMPWRLLTYVAFSDEGKATSFERYLKSGSGHAFANRRLW